jgi:hypothetical protein
MFMDWHTVRRSIAIHWIAAAVPVVVVDGHAVSIDFLVGRPLIFGGGISSFDVGSLVGVNKSPLKIPEAVNMSLDDSMETASPTTATTVDSLPTAHQRQILGS